MPFCDDVEHYRAKIDSEHKQVSDFCKAETLNCSNELEVGFTDSMSSRKHRAHLEIRKYKGHSNDTVPRVGVCCQKSLRMMH